MAGLADITSGAIDTAWSILGQGGKKRALTKVQWGFTTNNPEDYDPIADKMNATTQIITLDILMYAFAENYSTGGFSNRGLFIDQPIEENTFSAIMRAKDAKGNQPTIQDTFLTIPYDTSTLAERYTVRTVDLLPTNPAFIMTCIPTSKGNTNNSAKRPARKITSEFAE